MATKAQEKWQDKLADSTRRISRRIGGFVVVALGLGLAIALATHDRNDPDLSTAAAGPPANWLGTPGAMASDISLTLFGLTAILIVPMLLVIGTRMIRLTEPGRPAKQWGLGFLSLLILGTAIGLMAPDAVSGLPGGWGGVLGMAGAQGFDGLLGLIGDSGIEGPVRLSLMAVGLVGGLALFILALGIRDDDIDWIAPLFERKPKPKVAAPKKRKLGARKEVAPPRREPKVAEPKGPVVRAKSAKAAPRKQTTLALGDNYDLPSLDLLAPAEEGQNDEIDKAALERNARLLESVLEDFSVRGDIVEVKPGPVVTMYELEPASGIKASRIIQLADDIARNMSALSARVATIPGRSVIGIELPNQQRDMVMLSELIDSEAFDSQSMSLPIILGKNISGEPVIADLAPMPHLLVAGTTGSGKSVGLNAMILSLLYRMSPDDCRMIMIDPKMLELSIYDDIPHLLSPVVTEPSKAIRALKWAVEQMEERYRMMANLSVRSIANFNKKISEAKAKGKTLERKVQTGYDADTGQPTYEIEELEYEPLPKIVVVVDELADLMMTAGKEVEFLIQRLAQKARAAGIHLIMATQRPSVDVITGVIKANLPTRISFQVTSKIDSRTILGEQGAEQLLGKGDMLYMPGGKKIIRVHGPFVSDDEVRRVADHWRAQGHPDYIQAVTEEPEDGGYLFDGQPVGEDDAETQQFRKAVQIVAESQKASTSYLQRQMRVGYNTAARLIERMEKEGLVSGPDHVGRREVLIDPDGNPI
ncbi:DNA translocase FtsK [Sphingomicrobium marinum]|uniref:DNA translocase FtsK n=1 Tax=Sphingomicrobium marinum TaxID=1227950 RepID=UPI00223FE510|nr:DNA translocase FtsK [Sphingomicrobium marinum]